MSVEILGSLKILDFGGVLKKFNQTGKSDRSPEKIGSGVRDSEVRTLDPLVVTILDPSFLMEGKVFWLAK